MEVFGIRLVGVTCENGRKLLLTVLFILAVLALRFLLSGIARLLLSGHRNEPIRFWVHQAVNLTSTPLIILGVLSIWFDDPTRLTTAVGLVTAGLAFAPRPARQAARAAQRARRRSSEFGAASLMREASRPGDRCDTPERSVTAGLSGATPRLQVR